MSNKVLLRMQNVACAAELHDIHVCDGGRKDDEPMGGDGHTWRQI